MKAIILAGGSGTRLWPLSRRNFPKQFLSFGHDKSLFQLTIQRLLKILSFNDLIVITNQDYKFLVLEQMRGVFTKAKDTSSIILEPVGRNTAPAIALAAKYCLEKLNCDENEVLFVCPSDHVIKPVEKFVDYLKEAEKIAKQGFIVTFGVVPDAPKTGYGYIEAKNKVSETENLVYFKAEKFTEKPDLETAKKYLESGNYYWNSGMFAFQVGVIVEEIKKHAPEIGEKFELSYEEILRDFHEFPDISIDYAVMEKSDRIVTLPLEIYWNDIGAWDAVYEIMEKDELNNAFIGDVLSFNVKNSLIFGDKRLIAAIGIEDCIIIETEDALLISKKDKSQDVKKIVEKLRSQTRKEEREHITSYRPWGSFTVLEEGARY